MIAFILCVPLRTSRLLVAFDGTAKYAKDRKGKSLLRNLCNLRTVSFHRYNTGMSDDRPDWLTEPSPQEPRARRGSVAVHAAALFLAGVGASLALVAAFALSAVSVSISPEGTNRLLLYFGVYSFGSIVCLTLGGCLHWLELSARTMLLAAMIVQSIAGAVALVGSVVWLASVFLATSVFGGMIPPRDYTWDRFGPPLVAMLAAFFIAALGITGVGLARMGTTDGETYNHDDTTTRRRD